MNEQSVLQMKLKNIFFDIITNNNSLSINKKMLLDISRQLVDILQHKQIAIYILDEWNNQYKRMTVYPKYRVTSLQETIPLSEFQKKIPFQIDKGNIIIPINIGEKAFGYIISCTETRNTLDELHMSIIQKESEKLFKLLHTYHQMKIKQNRMKFANSFSSRLFSKVDKSNILEELLTSIQNLYPNFKFNVLLSQEYKVDPSLPIKLLNFSGKFGYHLSMTAFLTGEPQIEIDKYQERLKLYVPLEGKQAIYGVLEVETNDAINFPKHELDFISQLASFTGKAIENVALYQSSNEQIESLKLINETSKMLNSNMKLEEIIRIVRKKVMSICDCSELGFVKIGETEPSVLEESTPYFHTKEGQVLAHYLTHRNEQEPFFAGDFNLIDGIPYRSVMIIPMKHDVFTYGSVIILHEEPNYFTFENFKTIQSLIMHSTLSILNAFLMKQLKQTVKTDYVTKLYTRNHLDKQIHKHMKTRGQGTLILFDIDDFKKINDTFGHHIGDKVLKQVANIIQRNTRTEDIAARWGGEELAVYLPGVLEEKGVEIAKRISREVEMDTNPQITVSAGVSAWNDAIPKSVVELFIRTDQALYEAKNSGKNCVIMKSIL
ncbi:GGDEF domain-containing protein [Cerasibacillus terrae]|uniref:GGDEF domain-containing protein n=1 Tax=Cerasibacillus terrae TaxID=2498845 RepID=A0A5C8NHP1_9BACI|nr:sensor domain-containing diguanylate cyclase [Cerasibacillus terrae]TXL60537.1 GGDEF domain-containing protein [Cerasibacillus terrae]